MGNQQRNSSKDIGWLGGFIDGEGSLMMLKGQRRYTRKDGVESKYVDPAIKISGTEIKGLNHLTDILDKAELPYHITWREPQKAAYKKSWMVEVKGVKRCFRWCQVLLDCLVIKKHEAELMFEYCNLRLNNNHKAPYTERELGIIQALRGRRLGTRLC